jgi:transcriptional regulator with XRE-family HTH domain
MCIVTAIREEMVMTHTSTIRAARIARGVGVRELARRMNVTPGAVSQWERSEANHTIQANTLDRALEALRETSPSRPGPEPESAPFERRDERVSFELHRAIAKRLLDAPDAVRATIPAGLALIRPNARGPLVEAWLDEWLALSTGSIGALVDVLLGTDEHSIEMRQNSPFLGVLSQDERLEAIARATK